MKKMLKFGLLALAALSVFSFTSCSEEDEEEKKISEAQSNLQSIIGVRFGTGVSTKAIFKYYTVLEGNKVRYEQTKFGSYTSDVTWNYTVTENEDGTITLNLSDGVQAVEDAAYGNEPITFDFSTGTDTPTLTSTYYERGEPVETTGQFTRVYTGIEKVIGNTFLHSVSGKSISSSYAFKDDGTAEFKLIKYSKTTDYGHYKYQISAWNVLTDDEVYSTADSETKVLAFDKASLAHALNTYAVHFVYAATETYTLEANDYSQGYGNATVTTTKNVTEDEEPESPYIFITLVDDGVATINVTAATSTTAEDGTVTWAMSDSEDDVTEYTLYTE
ncbi:MAG: hypothetical protein IKP49_10800 [Treponema sp.]|nr:hypothetical protein [Treponema sp.]